jgi:hypothetical protein
VNDQKNVADAEVGSVVVKIFKSLVVRLAPLLSTAVRLDWVEVSGEEEMRRRTQERERERVMKSPYCIPISSSLSEWFMLLVFSKLSSVDKDQGGGGEANKIHETTSI